MPEDTEDNRVLAPVSSPSPGTTSVTGCPDRRRASVCAPHVATGDRHVPLADTGAFAASTQEACLIPKGDPERVMACVAAWRAEERDRARMAGSTVIARMQPVQAPHLQVLGAIDRPGHGTITRRLPEVAAPRESRREPAVSGETGRRMLITAIHTFLQQRGLPCPGRPHEGFASMPRPHDFLPERPGLWPALAHRRAAGGRMR